MARLTRTIHPAANFDFQPLTRLAPDMHVTATDQNGGGPAEEPMGLAFVDPDGETHIYVFSEQGRQKLVQALTGGLVLPGR